MSNKKGITETDQFVLFWGGWPSQWHPASFVIDGITYNCCEQFMMAEKARVFGDEESLRAILASSNPRQQKAIGRKVKNFNAQVWDGVSRGIVFTANLARFSQDPELKKTLLATESKTIVEASPTDRIWGIGLAQEDPSAADPAQWRGTNWLGIALMQAREVVRRGAAHGVAGPEESELQMQLDRRGKLLGTSTIGEVKR